MVLALAGVALGLLVGGATGSSTAVTGRYLLAFQACDPNAPAVPPGRNTGCREPHNHRVYLAQSDDGASWSVVPGWTPYAASVPDPIRRGNTIYLYSPGRGGGGQGQGMVARYHTNTGVLDPAVPIQVAGLADRGFVDPTAIQDSDGRLVLFFNPIPEGWFESFGKRCPGGFPCDRQIQSATEVAGSDGTRFTLDAGDRVSFTLTRQGDIYADPDIYYDGSQYVLLLGHPPQLLVYTSASLHGSFSQSSTLAGDRHAVAAGYFDPRTRRYWTYAHADQGDTQVIQRATSADVTHQLQPAEWTTVLTAAQIGLPANFHVESPGFAVNEAQPGSGGTTVSTPTATTPTKTTPAPKPKPAPKCKKGQKPTKKKPCRK